MSELVEALRTHGEQHKGTTLGGVLQWAALHIESQDEALADVREEHVTEEKERLRLEAAMQTAAASIEAALAAVRYPLTTPIELAHDLAPHINLMGALGDPDYQTPNGKMSMRHIDTRATKPRAKKAAP